MTMLLTTTEKGHMYWLAYRTNFNIPESLVVIGAGGIVGLKGWKMKRTDITPCAKAVSLFRGLYARVARDLGVDVSYVSRIAHGERKSKVAERALNKEFRKNLSVIQNSSSSARKALRSPAKRTIK
jgi:hypothetical protein